MDDRCKKKAKKHAKVKKKEVCKALVVRTKATYCETTGLSIKFNDNAVILMSKQGNPIGTRIIGPISRTLKKKTFQKIISIAAGLI